MVVLTPPKVCLLADVCVPTLSLPMQLAKSSQELFNRGREKNSADTAATEFINMSN